MIAGRELVDERGERRNRRDLHTHRFGCLDSEILLTRSIQQRAHPCQSHDVETAHGHVEATQAAEASRQGCECLVCPLLDRHSHPVVAIRRMEHSVDDQHLILHAQRTQFRSCAFGFQQCHAIRTCDEHERCRTGVSQGPYSVLIPFLLCLETGQRPETRHGGRTCIEEAAPGCRQLQQAQGVAGGRGVEYDMLEGLHQGILAEQDREFIECCHFYGAGAGELLFDPGELCVRHRTSIRRNGMPVKKENRTGSPRRSTTASAIRRRSFPFQFCSRGSLRGSGPRAPIR